MSEVNSSSYETSTLYEPLTEAMLGNLLAAVGNHEGKALLLLAMGTGTAVDRYYSQGELHDLISELPGSGSAYLGSRMNQMSWCKSSLAPIGMVAKADYAMPLSFGITPEGRELGVPFAAMLIDFSDKHSVALVELFGSTTSRSELRSPLLRMKLVEELLTHPEGANLRDLVAATGTASQVVIEKHLRKLDIAGLLKYRDTDVAKHEPSYRLVHKDYQPQDRGFWATSTVEFLRSRDAATLDEIVDHWYSEQPLGPPSERERSNVAEKLRYCLYGLDTRGLVTTVNAKRAHQRGRISLDEHQEAMWTDLHNLLAKFRSQDQPYISTLQRRAQELLREPGTIARALNRAAESSAFSRNDSKKDLTGLVLASLVESQQPLSVRDIVKVASEKQGRTVSHSGIVVILNKLVNQGAAGVRKNKVLKYSATEQPT